MASVEQAYLGLSQTAWTAIGALGTIALAILTLGTLIFIAAQALLARQAYVEGVLERTASKFSGMRADTLRLRLLQYTGAAFSWDDIAALRTTTLEYGYFASSAEFALRRQRAYGTDLIGEYLDDRETIVDLISFVQKGLKTRVAKFKEQTAKAYERFADEMGASNEEKAALKAAFEAPDVQRCEELSRALKLKKMVRDGASAEDVMQFEKQKGLRIEKKDLSAEHYASAGVDYDNVKLAEVWLELLGECLEALSTSSLRIQSALKKVAADA